jgi:hypothetical protein
MVLANRMSLRPGLLWLTLNLALIIQCSSWNKIYMYIFNFTYLLRCLRVRVPQIEYRWSIPHFDDDVCLKMFWIEKTRISAMTRIILLAFLVVLLILPREYHYFEIGHERPPLCSSGQSFWPPIQRSRVRFPALPDFLRSSGSGTGSIQPREDKWGATWWKSSGSGLKNRD